MRIGSDTGVYLGTMFNLGREAECTIGDFGTIVGPIISTSSSVTIGDYAFISYHVVLADTAFASVPDASDGVLQRANDKDNDIVIGDNVWIGVRASILGGSHIGEGAVIGAASVVDFDVPPYAIVAGNPSKVVGWAK